MRVSDSTRMCVSVRVRVCVDAVAKGVLERRFLDAIRTESTFTITKGTRRESGKGIGIGESTTIVVVIQIVVVVGSFLLLLLPTWPLLCAQLQVITVSSHLPLPPLMLLL